MIQVTGLNIKYDKCLIEDGNITVPDGAIVAISGQSGAGKTSILYRLGLISISEDYTYILDGEKVDIGNKRTVAKLQQNNIGFLFQDGTMIESLTVEENIIFAAQTAGMTIQKNEIKELLEMVELSAEKMVEYPLKLSGGERQRASLAMVLAKKTKYIIADEPTASLDRENSQIIINLLCELKKKGYSIVISTHSKEIIDIADIVYVIQDKKIICKSTIDIHIENYNKVRSEEQKSKKNILWYALHSKKKGKVLNGILIFFCAIAISGFAVTNNVMSYLTDMQNTLLKQLSDREIYAVNLSTSATDASVLDSDGNFAINKGILKQVSKMDGVDKLYDMIEWRSFNLNNPEITTEASINVISDSRDDKVNYSLDNSKLDYYIALPYFEEQNLEKQLIVQYGEAQDDSAYISYDLAKELGVAEYTGESLTLKFDIGVPVFKYLSENEQTGDKESELDLAEFKTLEIKVSGILNPNVTNSYTIDGNSVIYLPYDYMKTVMDKCVWSGDTSVYNDKQLNPWRPSAIVVYAESYKNVSILQSKINCITPNIVSKYAYQDTTSIEHTMQGLKKITNIVLLIVLGIIFSLMCAVYMSTTIGRKREYAILKTNGFTAKELNKITILESIIQAMKIVVLSLLISFVITTLICMLILGDFSTLGIETIIYVVILSILFVMVPSFLSIIYINRLKVEKIIRN